MKIQSTNQNQQPPMNINLLLDGADAASQAAILAHQDAQKSAEQAHESRQHEQQVQIDKMKQAAEKLREMAGMTLGSAILQGGVCVGMAVNQSIQTVKGTALSNNKSLLKNLSGDKVKPLPLEKIENLKQSIANLKSDIGLCNAMDRGVPLLSKVDPFALIKENMAVDKQNIDTEATIAGQQAQNESERLSEARRLESSYAQLLDKIESAHQAALKSASRI